MHTFESRLLEDWNIYCLQARPCIFQPGNFTDWGSERVNIADISEVNIETLP